MMISILRNDIYSFSGAESLLGPRPPIVGSLTLTPLPPTLVHASVDPLIAEGKQDRVWVRSHSSTFRTFMHLWIGVTVPLL